VGCGGATRALDRRCGAAKVADDGGQELRWAPARVVERRKKEEAMLHGGMGKRSREGLLGKL
jgi:hypothetical protein